MSSKLPVMLLAAILLLVAALAGGMFMIWGKLSVLSAAVLQNGSGGAGGGQIRAEEVKPVVSLDTFIVNLADPGGNRYLRVTMDLEAESQAAADEIAKRVPHMRDAVLMILPGKRFADIHSLEGKTALREEIIGVLNGMLGAEAISRIFFKEFVIQ